MKLLFYFFYLFFYNLFLNFFFLKIKKDDFYINENFIKIIN